jgi:geranylgeranyl diphosphate synthase type I
MEMNQLVKNKNIRKKLAEETYILLTKKDAGAYKKARKIIMNEKIKCEILKEALLYFLQELHEIKHPSLLSIACETVGGNPENLNEISAALLLLLGSAHIHDDIIDRTKRKNDKLTLYGKYGMEIALLVGDMLLFEGLTLLNQFCDKLPEDKKRIILNLIRSAFFEIGHGEIKEVIFRRQHNLSPNECLNYLKMRAALGEAAMRIGAIIGGGNEEEIEVLAHFGRTFGLLSALREEFIDCFDLEELKNRYRDECLPLPILYLFENSTQKEEILHLLQKKRITEEDIHGLIDIATKAKKVKKLKNRMKLLMKKELQSISKVRENSDILEALLRSTIEDIF